MIAELIVVGLEIPLDKDKIKWESIKIRKNMDYCGNRKGDVAGFGEVKTFSLCFSF